MSKKILSLAYDANLTVTAMEGLGGGGYIDNEDEIIKFANLIIAECISACATDTLGRTASAEELIKARFGIK